MRKNNKKGFTLVELVIVIAVIAILAAILIPTFTGVTKDAEEAARDADAKALYTQYINETVDANQEPATDFYIYADGYYYQVENGALDVENESATAPTGDPAPFVYNAPAANP